MFLSQEVEYIILDYHVQLVDDENPVNMEIYRSKETTKSQVLLLSFIPENRSEKIIVSKLLM